jgi:hypothetical protein
MRTLLDSNLTANGTVSFTMPESNKVTLLSKGDLGSGSIAIKVHHGVTVYDTGQTLTADGDLELSLAAGLNVQIILSGATDPDVQIAVVAFNEIS